MPSSILENVDTLIPPPPVAIHNAHHISAIHTTLPKTVDNERVTLFPIANGKIRARTGDDDDVFLPRSLVSFLHREFTAEIERGCTYPMEEAMTIEKFEEYWFGTFAVIAVLTDPRTGPMTSSTGSIGDGDDERNWEKDCLGTFYIKPNYPGFLTTSAARGKGVGMAMGKAYLDIAPRLGYTYSVFNLVFANNPASIKIWDRLGFNVIGRVPRAARLANSEELVDALIYGRELGQQREGKEEGDGTHE